MSRNRVVVMGIVAVARVLAWALPAAAKTAAEATTVTVTEGQPTEFGIKVAAKTVKAGAVTFKVTNKGNLPHDFKIGGKKTTLLQPGQSATLSVTLKNGKAAVPLHGQWPRRCRHEGHAHRQVAGRLSRAPRRRAG